jgi:predicted membrane chloride channel (bestrophin family)
MNLILTPEQKGLRLLEQRHSEAGQLAVVSRAIGRAINSSNADLRDEGARPSFTATLGALGNAIAEHLARLDDAQRAEIVAAFSAELPDRVLAYVAAAKQPAGRG